MSMKKATKILFSGGGIGDKAVTKQFIDDPPKIPVTKVDDPAAIPETGGDPLDALKRRKKRRGRAETIQAGSLIPENVGTKSLLG